MKCLALPILLVAMMIGCAPTQQPKSTLERGVPTGLTAADVALVQEGVRESLKDPDSARFGSMAAARLPGGGLFVCGFVNAKNSFGGYTGDQLFNGLLSQGVAFLPVKIASGDIENQAVRQVCAESGVAI